MVDKGISKCVDSANMTVISNDINSLYPHLHFTNKKELDNS